MSEEEKLYLLLGAGAVYAPFFVAASGRHGGGVWKFLSFCFCTFAVVLPIMDTFEEVLPIIAFISSPILLGLGIISWSFAWVLAVVVRSVLGESPLKCDFESDWERDVSYSEGINLGKMNTSIPAHHPVIMSLIKSPPDLTKPFGSQQ